MRTSFKIISTLFCITLFVASCSRKKDTFVSRNYHALSAKDNAMYNGSLALEDGRQALINSYQDDYWSILPVERMEVSDDIKLPGQSENENFNRAEEKAVKAIQKHSMNIKGKEVNPQMDEAYLLLGKARYFDQRFVPALEAFNYILYKHAASDKINQAKIWREKTNLRLEHYQLAIENLKRLLEQEELEKQDLADATSTLAQAYINTKSLDSAVTQLEIASNHTKNNDERGRYRYIQRQLYNKLGKKDSANLAFQEVIKLNRKTPRIYLIAAQLEQANNFSVAEGDKDILLETLLKLEENRENRPYLDKIYHQIGDYYKTVGVDSLAVEYYNYSLLTNSSDKKLKAINYEILGDYFFDYSEYKIAGAYYDSTMLNMAERSKPFRIIKRKRDNLEDVIYYENIAVTNDSILYLASLTSEEKQKFFEDYTNKLKIKAEEEKALEEARQSNQEFENNFSENNNLAANSSRSNAASLRGGPNTPPSSSFYFYNPTTVAYGKNEFIKKWGDRALEDDWRWSSKSKSHLIVASNNEEEALETDNKLFNPDYYIAQIPTESKTIDSISNERNRAYYQLGVIYKEKFKEYQLSKNTFQELLDMNPQEKLVLPSKYNLYKLYELLGENDEASIAKNEIIANYPESRYAAILQNPDAAAFTDENSPENVYKTLYNKLENQEYSQVIRDANKYIVAFEGEAIVSKIALLKATAIGRLQGFDAYSEALNFVALNYANTPEGIKAQDMVANVLPKLANKEFVDNAEDKNFKVVYYFTNPSEAKIKAFKEALDKEIKLVGGYDLSISEDIYNTNTTFILVHGLKSKEGATGYALALQEKKKNKIIQDFFTVSSSNYRIIQIHKNFDDYITLK